MTSPASGGWRHLRAVVVAVAVVALSAAGHVLGGGARPHPLALLVLASVATVPAYLGGRAQLRWGTLVVLLGTGQVVVHHVLASTGHAVPSAHHGPESAAAPQVSHQLLTPPMLLGHAAATLVVAALLAYGEAVLWGVWRWLQSMLRLVRPAATLVVGRVARMPASCVGHLSVAADTHPATPPRAPPVALCPTAG
jgi:hypothetical protein